MDARIIRAVFLTALFASFGAGYRTPNFTVEASNAGLAERVGMAAEKYRRELAVEWLGKEMPDWHQPCPITVQVAPHLGAGGETSFVFDRGEVFGWKMRVQGSEQRVLDSVLPHEVTHTVFATHFRRPLPRWADEGACTTVEHVSERTKQQNLLVTFLRTKRGIAFNQMFAMKEYPADVLPLYAQGYSLARYLIEQGGKRKFVNFVAEGMRTENWPATIKAFYGHKNLSDLQDTWLAWVKQGSPALGTNDGVLLASTGRSNSAEPIEYRGQSADDLNPRGRGDETKLAGDKNAMLAIAAPRTSNARNPSSAAASAFDRSKSWDNSLRTRGRDAADTRLALNDTPAGPAADVSRMGKPSVYERGIEPSGNKDQYPFKSSVNRPADRMVPNPRVPSPAPQAAEESARPSPNSDRQVSTSDRRVLLQWSRDREPTVDAAW